MTTPTDKNRLGLTLGALGVVFGDIGTSPLYALGQCFHTLPGQTIDLPSVLGVLSLIFWSLILVVCVKYVTFVLNADHHGEGGTMALLGLIQSKNKTPRLAISPLVLLVFFGSALLFGDSVITPSISVLSAIEGLKVATPAAQPLIVPLALIILAGLFLLQRSGTQRIGVIFGPVMVLWFLVIALLGGWGIVQSPRVLEAIDPLHGIHFIMTHGWEGLFILSAVVLCFSGAEALFADLGHYGKGPIRLAWYGLVLPSLVLNYFGQGALILRHPSAAQSPFYGLVSAPLLYPLVILSTLATIIASQAVISGAFSLTEQAINMGYFPRFRIEHTSEQQRGQIYVGAINWSLMFACLAVVIGFGSSDRLTGAYGLAVIGTMIITSITYFVVLRQVWKWSMVQAVLVAGSFFVMDLTFLAGNVLKVLSGAWVPLLVAGFVFSVFWIWTAGQQRYLAALKAQAMPLDEFTDKLLHHPSRLDGTAIFLTGHSDRIPLVGKNLWLLNNASHEQIILLTVVQLPVPFVDRQEMSQLQSLAPGLFRLTLQSGFMQQPDVSRILKGLTAQEINFVWDSLVCYLPEPKVIARGGWFRRMTQQIYVFLRRNSLSAADYFRIPPNTIIHVGLKLEV